VAARFDEETILTHLSLYRMSPDLIHLPLYRMSPDLTHLSLYRMSPDSINKARQEQMYFFIFDENFFFKNTHQYVVEATRFFHIIFAHVSILNWVLFGYFCNMYFYMYTLVFLRNYVEANPMIASYRDSGAKKLQHNKSLMLCHQQSKLSRYWCLLSLPTTLTKKIHTK
jgi:hypothetical protein